MGVSLLTRGTTWNGAFSTSTYYEIGDLVEYSSSAYISVASTNINVTPGTDVTKWQAFAIGDSAALLTTKGDITYQKRNWSYQTGYWYSGHLPEGILY